MIAYHGTTVGNLETLRPFANPDSNLKYPCVYLSTSKALAAIYIWNRPFKWMTFEIQKDGIPVYNETFQNGLYEFYHGVKGYLYTCEGDFETDENTKISCAVISENPVVVKEAEVVEDAYERLLEYERQGLIKINHFEDLTDRQRRRDRNMVLREIQSLDLQRSDSLLAAFVREKFPEAWEEAREKERQKNCP